MTSNLADKKILIGVTGGIAAYKSCELIRMLRKLGAQVKVIMTKSATEFVTPLTMQALSGNIVYDDLFKRLEDKNIEHIELAKWADAIIVAPATANFMARLAHGFADDLLTTVCLASTCLIAIAPAMNTNMWLNFATWENLQKLIQRGVQVFGPVSGELACGDVGVGKMLEPIALVDLLSNIFIAKRLNGKKVLITAGPTYEPIDPVRYIANKSSGKMGYGLADAANKAGAEVVLISGPTNLIPPNVYQIVNVETASEMFNKVMEHIDEVDIFIGVAAVADYTPEIVAKEKIKKNGQPMSIKLTATCDVIAAVTALPEKPFVVGFVAETENLLENAKAKMLNKKVDMIIANKVPVAFNTDDNEVIVLLKNGDVIDMPKMFKNDLAQKLIELIIKINNFSQENNL